MSQEESSKNVTTDEEKRLGNDSSQRPSAFMVALENMKGFTQKALVIDMREQINILSGSTSVVAGIML